MLREAFDTEVIKRLEKKLTSELKEFINKVLDPNLEDKQYSGSKIDKFQLVKSMDILPVAFDLLMRRDHWNLNFCLWIANEVGYPINLTVGRKLVNITFPGFVYLDLEKNNTMKDGEEEELR